MAIQSGAEEFRPGILEDGWKLNPEIATEPILAFTPSAVAPKNYYYKPSPPKLEVKLLIERAATKTNSTAFGSLQAALVEEPFSIKDPDTRACLIEDIQFYYKKDLRNQPTSYLLQAAIQIEDLLVRSNRDYYDNTRRCIDGRPSNTPQKLQ